MQHYQNGWTLIELAVVMVIITIVSLVVVMRWPGEGINLEAQAQQLASDIRYTQALAMTRGERYRINFTAGNYGIAIRTGTAVPHPVIGTNTISFPAGIALSSPSSFIVFDGQGSPYTDATLPGTALAADAVISLSGGGSTINVRISPQTGRVLVQ